MGLGTIIEFGTRYKEAFDLGNLFLKAIIGSR